MRNSAFSIVAAALTVSFVTAAQSDSPTAVSPTPQQPLAPQTVPAEPVVVPAAPTATSEAKTVTQTLEPEKKKLPFAGTQVVYGHSASVFTLAPGAEPMYNPTWAHHIDLSPRWNFNDKIFVSALVSVSQELTLSDTTTYKNEFEFADARLTAGWTGWEESVTGIKLAADLRLTFPASKTSLAQTRVLSIGPGLNVSKKFDLRGGLKLSYGVRPSYRFHRYTTLQFDNPVQNVPGCRSVECFEVASAGKRNAPFDITHGPQVAFELNDKFSFEATYVMAHRWLYPVSGTTPAETSFRPDTGVVHINNFTVAANWQVTPSVGLSLGADTLGPQLGFDGRYIFPMFNRNTTLYLDASFDVEAFVSGLN